MQHNTVYQHYTCMMHLAVGLAYSTHHWQLHVHLDTAYTRTALNFKEQYHLIFINCTIVSNENCIHMHMCALDNMRMLLRSNNGQICSSHCLYWHKNTSETGIKNTGETPINIPGKFARDLQPTFFTAAKKRSSQVSLYMNLGLACIPYFLHTMRK